MKAIVRYVYGSPDVLRLEDVPTPAPHDDEVLVRVRASSVNRTDLESLTGRPAMYRAFMGVRRPRSKWLGLDAAGEVEAVGAGVTRFKPGDRVYADLLYDGNAAFAEFACAREKAWRPMPEGMDFETTATLPASAVLCRPLQAKDTDDRALRRAKGRRARRRQGKSTSTCVWRSVVVPSPIWPYSL